MTEYTIMKRLHHTAWLACLCAGTYLFASCQDFLDIKPYDKTIPETAEDYSAMVHNLCNNLDEGTGEAAPILGNYTETSELESISDNMEVNLSEANTMLSTYIGDRLNNKQSVYKNLYKEIGVCNIILNNFDQDLGSRESQDILGFSYAVRGVCYYQLLRQFCEPPLSRNARLGVPLVTEFDMEARPVRSDIQSTINRIENDLKTAISYDIQNPMYRFNNDILHGYLARLYHWCGRWKEAREEALALLKKYPLLSGEEYKSMITTQYGLVGNRMIMSSMISGSSSLGVSGTLSHLQERPLSIRYLKLFTEGERDIRYNFYWNKKRKNNRVIFSGLRSAEMAFIAMECAYHLNETETALAELNAFRRLRISDYEDYTLLTLPAPDTQELIQTDATGETLTPLINAILNERRKEFYMENGDRWFELKRNGGPEWWVMGKGKKYWTRHFMYCFPLPVEDVELNPGLIQNPGYEETY